MLEIVPVESPEGAQRALFDEWAQVYVACGRELFGDHHSAWTADQLRALHHGSDRTRLYWAACLDGQVVGAAGLIMPMLDNTTLAQVPLAVLPQARRRGVGSRLLAVAEQAATEHGRSVLVAETQWPAGGRDWSGVGFAVRHGYQPAQTVLRSTLALPVDLDLVQSVLDADGAEDYDLHTMWDGIPQAWLDGRAELSRRMSSDAPLGELQLAEERWDAERVRQEYERIAAMGRRSVDTFARHRASGTLVGYTQVQVTTDRPEVAYQQDTLVMAEHRGHGLGLRLKAATALALMEASPGTRLVRTWNADDNAPMLAVNDRLGYVRDGYLREWQKVTTAR